MTLDEAKKVAFVVGHADNGCSTCVEHLVDLLSEHFPDFEWENSDVYEGDRLAVNVFPTPPHA